MSSPWSIINRYNKKYSNILKKILLDGPGPHGDCSIQKINILVIFNSSLHLKCLNRCEKIPESEETKGPREGGGRKEGERDREGGGHTVDTVASVA